VAVEICNFPQLWCEFIFDDYVIYMLVKLIITLRVEIFYIMYPVQKQHNIVWAISVDPEKTPKNIKIF
jgi:hypothetical protein